MSEEELETLRREKQELEDKLRGVPYLEEDRRQLHKEVMQLRAQNAELQQTLDKLQVHNLQLSGETQVLRTNIEGNAARKQGVNKNLLDAIIAERWVAASDEQKSQDEAFRKRLKLPAGEYSLTYYGCTDGSHRPGNLHISPQYLCWEHTSLLGGENITIQLGDIEALNKIKILKFMPGKGRALSIKMRDGKLIQLNALLFSRKQVIQKIVAQAKILGHNVIVLREGAPDENSGVK